MRCKILAVFIGILIIPSMAWSFELYRKGDISMSIGYWAQAWYQYVNDYDRDGDGDWDDDVNDFMVRRTYFSVSGTITPELSFFVHFSGDRIGQEGLDKPSVGLGSGLALRDGWLTYKLLGNDLMVQMGRMYIPFTRNYGTTSTKSLLTTELDWGQGGLRSGILYPSKVGRDDSVTIWGNVLEDRLQYRFMTGEGEEDSTLNPDDNLRFAGRLSYNFFDTETAWFNAGTYLGKKKILALGCGFDYQQDIIINGTEDDYKAFTVDLHLDIPLNSCAVTAEFAWLTIDNIINTVTWSDLKSGTDGDMYTAKAGILLNKNIQPFAHCELVDPDESGTDDTIVYGFGCNYYIKGPANKLTAEYSIVDDDTHTVDIFTFQAAFGF